MRFDDSLDTVLAADMAGAAGVQSAWRQLVDLIGRGRGGVPDGAIVRLRAIRDRVPVAIRSASARGLERADPPAALVALFAEDAVAVAGPVVRSARLTADEWLALLPAMQPATRGILRHRRDLEDRVAAALAGFGPSDFALPGTEQPVPAPAASPGVPWVQADPPAPLPPFVAPEPDPFVPVADIARDLPVVAEARRLEAAAPPPVPVADDFAIAALVARIEAHQRATEAEPRPAVAASPPPPADRFAFETDADGVIRWCEGVERGPVVGLTLAAAGGATDGNAGGAFARRTRFADARLAVPGTSPAGGAWRISGVPAFDRASGRFTGYRGVARRPRADEEPRVARAVPTTDALRQLVHELRTPANAISGFAEMIQHQLLGPVPADYRAQAATIVGETGALLGAIDDIDTAARLESGRLDLRCEQVPLTALLARLAADLRPLADLRGARLAVTVAEDVRALGDAVAVERLFARLLAAVVSTAAPDEVLEGTLTREGEAVRFALTRPAALVVTDGALFGGDAEAETGAPGAPLLGAGFAFRLARRLATELGGTLTIAPDRLTLRLPAAVDDVVEQATV